MSHLRTTICMGLLALAGLVVFLAASTHGSAEDTLTGSSGFGSTGTDGYLNGDINCNENVDAVDALGIQREIAALPVSQQPGCPALGEPLARISAGLPNLFGDVDCNGFFDAVDSLKILRWIAALAVMQEDGCPEIGTGGAGPSSTPTPQTTKTAGPTSTATPGPTTTATPTPGPTATKEPTGTPSTTPSADCADLKEPIPIPDGTGFAEVSIPVTSTGVVERLWLCVNIAHSWIGDLVVRLDSPNGTEVSLIDRPGYPFSAFGCDGFDIRVLLDDSASQSVEGQCEMSQPSIDGTFRPDPIMLEWFNDEVVTGTWRVRVYDVVAEEAGELLGAQLWYEVSQ